MNSQEYDVVICGGGLAGLCLARQLKLENGDISVLVLEKNRFPLREAAHKVGESTVEIAGFYLRESLQLKQYFKNEQYRKCGLRYFFKEGFDEFSDYPEIGLSEYASVDSYQIDRGKLENDLYFLNKQMGVSIKDGVSVDDILLREGNANHEILYVDGAKGGTQQSVSCKWVIDATGRRSILQKKLGLRRKLRSTCSSAWFRVKGRLDVSDFVPEENINWHRRVPHKIRYYSTIHLMGNGYWIWLIPLINGNTSVGIVVEESLHDYTEFNSYQKALHWIKRKDPFVGNKIESFEMLDFLGLRNYSYSSNQVFSENRWACTGEAALFPDPFYSPGSNLIGYSNSIITQLVNNYIANRQIDNNRIEFYNQFIIFQNDWLVADIQSAYPYFGNSQVESLRYIWDIFVGWTIAAPQMFNSIYLDEQKTEKVQNINFTFFIIAHKVRKLFSDWSRISKGTFSFQFIDYLKIPFIKELYDRCLQSGKTVVQLIEDYTVSMQRIEEFVQVLFYLILEDCMPEALEKMKAPFWINPIAVSLSVELWEKDGLFTPKEPPRDFSDIERQVRSLYTFHNN
ncbi:MAG TPA: NAD(P)/FAD-dependent oxidoreductase [Puia sp.]|jgi:flavin-dependent dehydrogenase|nr:NAD(P)/FAD-dependent oxidoreductase [Puia sp.]